MRTSTVPPGEMAIKTERQTIKGCISYCCYCYEDSQQWLWPLLLRRSQPRPLLLQAGQ